MNKNQKITSIEWLIILAFLLSAAIYFATNNTTYNQFYFIGLVWCILLGLGIGSYTTSFIARIPYNMTSLGKRKARCASCDKNLEPRDLFPIFSYLSTNGKCRFCSAKIPPQLLYAEIIVLALFILFYLKQGFTEQYFVISTFSTVSVTTLFVYFKIYSLNKNLLYLLTLLGVSYKLSSGSNITDVIFDAFIIYLISVISYNIIFKSKKILADFLEDDFVIFNMIISMLLSINIWLKLFFISVILIYFICLLSKKKEKDRLFLNIYLPFIALITPIISYYKIF